VLCPVLVGKATKDQRYKITEHPSTVQFNLTHNSKECVAGLCVLISVYLLWNTTDIGREEKHENNKLRRPSTGILIRTLFQRLTPTHRGNYKLKG
jgi:hypothetical protein